jgi:hypothetical protein
MNNRNNPRNFPQLRYTRRLPIADRAARLGGRPMGTWQVPRYLQLKEAKIVEQVTFT